MVPVARLDLVVTKLTIEREEQTTVDHLAYFRSYFTKGGGMAPEVSARKSKAREAYAGVKR